jgi:hypothetical protein
MKHLTRNERSPRLPVCWMNRDESRGRGREAQALSRLAKEVCKHARSSTYSGRALRRQVTAWQALELTPSFFPQASAAIRGPNMAFLLVLRICIRCFGGTEMKTNVVSLARKLPVSERRVETGARRAEGSEGQTGRRLPIAAMQAMTAFASPMSICHSLQTTVKRYWPTTWAWSNRPTSKNAAATNRPTDWDDQ